MAHWLWLRCQKPRPPSALTFCLQRASNQKNHTFKQNKMNRGAAPIIDMDSFCKGFSTLVQDSLQCCANPQTGPLSFAALLSFSVYHVSLQFQSLEVRKQLRSKAR